ncbi:hypothetical protein KAR91_56355 [Candidatus Pacearchaeota archaeon]|nr:hypothetical protein [Candidatus Pacearchaeota archaeon]
MAGGLTPSDFSHGYYEFTGQVSNEIVDLSGAGFNLAVNGATDVSSAPFGNGLSFDGLNDIALSAQARFSDITETMSVVLVVKLLRSATGNDFIYGKGNNLAGGQDFLIYISGNTSPRYRVNNVGDVAIGASLGITSYHLLVFTYDKNDTGQQVKISTDGAAFTTFSRSSGNIRNSDDFGLGGTGNQQQYCNMITAQFGITSNILTQDNVNFLWNGGAFRQLSVAPTQVKTLMMMES